MMKNLRLYFHRLWHWEYWSFEAIYTPLVFIWIYYAIRAKSFFFFNASNPSIKNGGFLMESKKEIYDIIPEQYYPKTLLFSPNTNLSSIFDNIEQKKITFPLIAKPDIGMKGLAVEKINDKISLQNYLSKIQVDFLIQELITFPNEIGIFYYRLPNKKKGHISGIVHKEFLTLVGNGINTMIELLQENSRFYLQLNSLKKIYGAQLNIILKKNETFNLVPYGNHSRGAKFTDVTHWNNEKLTQKIDEICQQVPHFYYGRLDIKYNNFEELQEGKNFSIIEINGAGSEPTHIYDPKHSIFWAWREIIKHWDVLFKISQHNYKKGFSYLNFSEGIKMLRDNKKLVQKLKQF
ncbi:MAG: D-alanine--D-alanine ligase [Bacteroidetes bacterium]|nr:MAG: D-alanine--D-alanine ligase [Bacteroidota bacterium]TAG92188.1 MAG: D-alanine--D-alanine ligase [Bacteroidota bacterium]